MNVFQDGVESVKEKIIFIRKQPSYVQIYVNRELTEEEKKKIIAYSTALGVSSEIHFSNNVFSYHTELQNEE